MQFGLDTKHWKIPFVYFVTIVLSWRRKLHGSMMPCDTWLLYCQVQKIFYWFDQCTTLVVDSLIITNCKHYIRHICLLWKGLCYWALQCVWIGCMFLFLFLAFQCAFCETCFTCISIFNSIGLQNTWNWIAHLVTWKTYASIHFYHSQQKRKERER